MLKRFAVATGGLLLVLAAFVAGRHSGVSHNQKVASRHILYYIDPMHPAYHSDKPGIAPDCGMALEPVYEGEDPKLQLSEGAVAITPDKQQLIGVELETVKKSSGSRVLRTTGRVEPDDNRVYRIMPGTEGWVQSLENNPPGTVVKKDQLLAAFYSREFRNAEQAYVGALASVDRVKTSRSADDAGKTNDASVRSTEEQLHALGMGDPQIQELAKTRQLTRDIEVASPVDGIILARDISPQQRFEAHTEIYKIADLSRVWIVADLFGDEVKALKSGTRVRVTATEIGKSFYATVGSAPAWFDPTSRTMKIRMETANPGWTLRPGMFVDVELTVPSPVGITVPQQAVLDSGLKKIVYVESSEGVFDPHPVELGGSYGDRVAITRGLSEGDRIVTSGNFLIDSESRMRSSSLSASPNITSVKAAEAPSAATADPVCGMPLGRERIQNSSHRAKYRGEEFVFCSDKCQRKFELDPGKYAGIKVGSAAQASRNPGRADD